MNEIEEAYEKAKTDLVAIGWTETNARLFIDGMSYLSMALSADNFRLVKNIVALSSIESARVQEEIVRTELAKEIGANGL